MTFTTVYDVSETTILTTHGILCHATGQADWCIGESNIAAHVLALFLPCSTSNCLLYLAYTHCSNCQGPMLVFETVSGACVSPQYLMRGSHWSSLRVLGSRLVPNTEP